MRNWGQSLTWAVLTQNVPLRQPMLRSRHGAKPRPRCVPCSQTFDYHVEQWIAKHRHDILRKLFDLIHQNAEDLGLIIVSRYARSSMFQRFTLPQDFREWQTPVRGSGECVHLPSSDPYSFIFGRERLSTLLRS